MRSMSATYNIFILHNNCTLKAVQNGRIRTFKQAGAEPFPELEQILIRCLQKDRSQRYQSFDELNNAFSSIRAEIYDK